MKRYLALILFTLLWASRSKDSAIVPPDNNEKPEVVLPYTPSAAVAGRAVVAYITYNGARSCYYDNPQSIEYKSKWALGKGFYGVMYWENDCDDASFTLRRAAWEGVMN